MIKLLFCLCFYSTVFAATTLESTNGSPKCTSDDVDCITACQEICGCDGFYKFDESKGECVVDLDYLKEKTEIHNYITEDHDVVHDEGMAKKLRETNEKVFRGLIGAAIFFIFCASFGVVSVCIFCCRIHYNDAVLRNDVKALSEKLNRTKNQKQVIIEENKRRLLSPIEESCNVVVADSNILCV